MTTARKITWAIIIVLALIAAWAVAHDAHVTQNRPLHEFNSNR